MTSDEFRALPDPKYYPQKIRLDLKLYDKKYKSIDSVSRVEYASEIEALTKAKGDMIVSVTSGYSDSNSQSVKVHSNGFLGEKESSSFSIGAEITVNDPDGGLPEDWYWVTTRFYDDLPSPDAISDEVFRRVQQKLGQKKIDSGAYDLILENRVGGRVIRQLMQPMNGSSLQQKNSWMDGLLGERVASEKLTIIDDPFIEKAMGSRFYDGDGLASQKRVMIEKGILKHFYIDNYYGRKLNMEPTSGGASNLVFEYGEKSLEGLISGVDKGILVNGIIGGNSNSTTGDFSFGVMGLLIENGRITQPVNEMNVSGSAKEFWRNLVEMGNDPNPYSSRKIPSMYFKDVFFSGI
ncbi:MAG: TldD/PmbA family protein [FCB group bacterium]|nr:TldD/PmbA family protein [FCB group bacterium]